ncbi:alpha/beta hydrolase [Nocardia puris]|uniref:Pimeloyl-ACP methyl ester carboxylesterase n=1 Tax=Nocardia puris TaxID=208602 RepID=A0A366E3S8_9NOCA|nr:alpha/beta hydrolase [Nocardia puris]MBF6209675.1 alpha/beta hydrolase [Nocardia puris]MBF6366247.1 alpha/beta hydrolase [Nocardia puris]MBF6458414.1 alpha/beta hydrolase [Nocardia puris]RBO96058.1 pimeloyl-ACP methyl ester carboxylesterase [Nocardia puris]
MDLRTIDEGSGPPILIVHGGMDDGSAWTRVAARLTPRFRVLRPHRRRYRLDLTPPATLTEEADDILALAAGLDEPPLLVGHSSGAVVALEAAAAAPRSFAGLLAYEPPVTVDEPFDQSALRTARAAVDAGKPGKAVAIFERDLFGASLAAALLFRVVVTATPRLRAWVPRQIDDLRALDQLGRRLDTYATIDLPTVLLGGQRSPAHLGERIDALLAVMPNARKVVLAGQAHNANDFAPRALARIIEEFAVAVHS